MPASVVSSTVVEAVAAETGWPTIDYWPAENAMFWGRRFGAVYPTWLGRRYVYLLGPEANEFVFANDGLFRVREAFRGLIPVDGPTALIVTDGPDHARRRALVRPSLHHRQVAGYVETMAGTADEALDRVVPGTTIDGYQLFRAAIRRSTLRTLFGERLAEHADTLGGQLQPLLSLADLMPDVVEWHARLNTPRYRRAMAARAAVIARIDTEIARIRNLDHDAESQVLAMLVHGRDGTGSGLTDDEIHDQAIMLIAAGYETTSAAMGWLLYTIGPRPELQDRLRAELAEVTGGRTPTSADLGRLPLLSATVTETLRLYPPAAVSARYVAEEFTFGGRRVRPGTTLLYSPYATHRDPRVYAEPRVFRPERWLGDERRPAAEFLPFGGGIHRCIGSSMATTELTVMLTRLIARGLFSLPTQRIHAQGISAMRPREGVQIRLATG